mmetsp:Transcript_19256/g.32682  ORF Transcript_19256/g.32682 Transcript_19256/m.32682 type:complete len:206 (+) Transcript_19256:1539-2156(+)
MRQSGPREDACAIVGLHVKVRRLSQHLLVAGDHHMVGAKCDAHHALYVAAHARIGNDLIRLVVRIRLTQMVRVQPGEAASTVRTHHIVKVGGAALVAAREERRVAVRVVHSVLAIVTKVHPNPQDDVRPGEVDEFVRHAAGVLCSAHELQGERRGRPPRKHVGGGVFIGLATESLGPHAAVAANEARRDGLVQPEQLLLHFVGRH